MNCINFCIIIWSKSINYCFLADYFVTPTLFLLYGPYSISCPFIKGEKMDASISFHALITWHCKTNRKIIMYKCCELNLNEAHFLLHLFESKMQKQC